MPVNYDNCDDYDEAIKIKIEIPNDNVDESNDPTNHLAFCLSVFIPTTIMS